MNLNRLDKQYLNKLIFIGMILSVFLVSFYVRQTFLKQFASMNYIYIIILLLYIILNLRNVDKVMLIYITYIIFYIFIVDYIGNNNSIISIIRNISMIIIPIYLFTVKTKIENLQQVMTTILKCINFIIIIIFVIGIIDPFINFKIMSFFGGNITPELNKWIIKNKDFTGYRYTSFMGHPLVTKELFIYFFIMNMAYYKKFKKQLINKYIVMVISLVGVLLTGSKSGIVLIIITIVFSEIIDKKRTNLLVTLIIISITYSLGLFNNVILRFQSGSLTTGRAEGWEYINQLGILSAKFFSGYGENIFIQLSNVTGNSITTAALEYPVRILLYKYGFICTIMIISILFLYPIKCFIKRKQFYLLFLFIIKLIDVNLYNGLIFKADNMILFVLFTYFLLQLSNSQNVKKCIVEES